MEQGSNNLLPEACIANILSLTSPQDACRSSAVSSVFQSAADSDLVWERFLPSDIHQILLSSVSTSLRTFSSKKELFLHVCDNPLLIDRGTKTFALEKRSGKKCYMIGARELSVTWGHDQMYWNWFPLPESRFSEVTELLDVYSLEIRGKIETRLLSPKTKYGAYLVFKLTDMSYGFDELVKVSVKWASGTDRAGEGEVKYVFLDPEEEVEEVADPQSEVQVYLEEEEEEVAVPRSEVQVPKERGDGWMEIEMGEFFNERGEDGELEMNLKEVPSGHWKSGLIIHGIELRPKENQ